MIPGLISQELRNQLLDPKNYLNRTDGVEELKRVLSEVDIKSVPSDSVKDFINFLPQLLDDSNFKVLYGALQVLNILIQKLDTSVEKYLKLLLLVAFKALGHPCIIPRTEYMNVFQRLMKTVAPQQVLDLLVSNLKHNNSRVREDVLNIIMAAMLTHPRRDFDIDKLCYEVAPYLADNNKKVRHAALELFAVFDRCLDTGTKQPLMKAVDMVELNQDAEGLMAAVQARRARRVLPKLSSEGIVEYGLVVPKPGQRSFQHNRSGADLDWVINRGQSSSARSHRTEPDSNRLYGYGSLGSLTDDHLLQRRIVSAGKGKNKFPWEMSSVSSTENGQQCNTPNRNRSEQMASKDCLPPSRRLSPETYIPSFSSADPQKQQGSRINGPPTRLRRSGSLNLELDIFKTTNFCHLDAVAPKGLMLQRNPSVERTCSLTSNPTTSGLFLLPSYPLAALQGGMLTPTISSRHGDSSLSMSNTWPNKRENSPNQRNTTPCRDTAGTAKGDLSRRCSPRPLRATLMSPSSYQRALSSSRATHSISPVVPPVDQAKSHNDQSYNAPASPQNQQLEKSPQLDPDGFSAVQDPQEDDDSLDKQEMMNSLRSLHNSAAKKRAKMSLRRPAPDSPHSVVRLDLDSFSHASPKLTSSASESGLSSLSLVANTNSNGLKTSPGIKPRIARVPPEKLRPSVSMDFSSLQGSRGELPSEVGVVGQRLTYSNGTFKAEMETTGTSPSLVKPDFREAVRGLNPTKVSRLPVVLSLELGDSVAKPPSYPSAGVYNNTQSNSPLDSDDSPHPEFKGRVKKTRFNRDKLEQECQVDNTQENIRHRVRKMFESPTEEKGSLIIKDLLSNGSTGSSTKADNLSTPRSPSSPASPPRTQSPHKCVILPHQPSPPTVPPNPKNLSRRRRAPSLSRTQPLSRSSEDLESFGTTGHMKNEFPFPKPNLPLSESLDLLNSEKWKDKIEGMMSLRSLAYNNPDKLQYRLHDICLSLIQEVKNLRSKVSRVAVCTLGDLYTSMQKLMDQELEWTVKALLQQSVEVNAFIRKDVDVALDCMVQHCTPTRSIKALLAGGLCHHNAVVRKCTAQHLANLVEKVGAARLLSEDKDVNRILPAATKFAKDPSQDVRYFGRQMLLSLSFHPDFDKMLEKYIAPKELQSVQDIVFSLKTKGHGEMPQDTQSARSRRLPQGNGLVRASSLTREPLHQTNRKPNRQYSCKSQIQRFEDKALYIEQILGLLASKDFKERIQGISQLVDDCQHNPKLVIESILPLFDAFKARLLESNSKVNLHALESLQKIIPMMKDNMSQVVNILFPAIVDNHLNSKSNAIYSAAVAAIDALILNLDNVLVLQLLCNKATYVNGKAKVELIERVADIVTELYPHKPQIVKQKVLPLLWHLLGTPTHSGTLRGRSTREATSNLCQALHAQMGSSLRECVASQPCNIRIDFNRFLEV